MSTPKESPILSVVRLVPIGCVASYGQIADLAGLPRRARLVGKVLKGVPNKSHLPWHRVLRTDGRIAFDRGSDQGNTQTHLLRIESVIVKNHRVDMNQFQWKPDLDTLLFRLHF